MNGTHGWLERVPTDDNISDLPSRTEYRLLEELGAQWRPAALAQNFISSNPSAGAQLRREIEHHI